MTRQTQTTATTGEGYIKFSITSSYKAGAAPGFLFIIDDKNVKRNFVYKALYKLNIFILVENLLGIVYFIPTNLTISATFYLLLLSMNNSVPTMLK